MKIKSIVLICNLLLCLNNIHAFGPEHIDGWDVTVGAGIKHEPVYSGSDKYTVQPYPFVDVTYTYENLHLYAGLKNGLGVKFFSKESGLFIMTGIDMGLQRDRSQEQTKKLLIDSANLENPILVYTTMGWNLEYGEITTRLEYYAVDANYQTQKDEHYNALTLRPALQSGYPVLDDLILLGSLGFTLMNQQYADAYHSVKYETEKLKQFDAQAGFESVNGELMFLYSFNKKIMLRGSCEGKKFLADAESSPFTQSKWATESMLTLMYTF